MDLSGILGPLIRTERLRQGLRLEEVSRLSGVGIATLSNFENGNRDIRLSTLSRVLGALRVELGDLLQRPAADLPDEGGGYDL